MPNGMFSKLFGKKSESGAICIVDDARIVKLPNGDMADRVSFWQCNQKGKKEVHKTILLRTDGISVCVGFETTLGELRKKAYEEKKDVAETCEEEKAPQSEISL